MTIPFFAGCFCEVWKYTQKKNNNFFYDFLNFNYIRKYYWKYKKILPYIIKEFSNKFDKLGLYRYIYI